MRQTAIVAGACALATLVAGCLTVDVRTPEPLEINLNVTIRQEEVARVENDAEELLNARPDIF